MITEVTGDIFNNLELDAIAHQCNCFHTMGGGIARIIAQKYPLALEADKRTAYGSKDKLGDVSTALVQHELDNSKNIVIFNCYSQYNFGGGVQTHYDSVRKVFNFIKTIGEQTLFLVGSVGPLTLGIPYGYGCGLAGGDWTIVRGIIDEVFGDSKNINVQICKLPD